MSKTKHKPTVVEPEVVSAEPESILEETTDQIAEEVVIEPENEPVYIPEIPAQMEEEVIPVVNEVKLVSDEIGFLQNILQIQRNGGFGRHLDGIINDRIKTLKGL
jgi:hypothetical protein